MTRKEEIQQAALELYPIIYSSSRERDAYVQGAEWADKTLLDRICEWVKKHYQEYAHNQLGMEYLTNDLRKAVEE